MDECRKFIEILKEKEDDFNNLEEFLDRFAVPPECHSGLYNFFYKKLAKKNKSRSLDALALYIESINEYKILTPKEEKELFKKYQKTKDKKIKNKIVESNLRLVVNLAKKYLNDNNKSILQDLIEEGNIGLMVAVDHYDLSKGASFATYATYWIKHYIQEYLYKSASVFKFSERIFHKYQKYRKMIREANNENRTVNDREIKKKLKLNNYTLSILKTLFNTPLNIDDELQEKFFKNQNETFFDIVNKQLVIERLFNALKTLNEKEQTILKFRYGIDSDGPLSLSDIGKRLGISKQRVYQIEKRALQKLYNILKGDEIWNILLLPGHPKGLVRH